MTDVCQFKIPAPGLQLLLLELLFLRISFSFAKEHVMVFRQINNE
jgi:hypothetical protein